MSDILATGSAIATELLLFIRDLARGVSPYTSLLRFLRYRCRGTATQQSYFILFAVGFGALPRVNLLRFVDVGHSTDGQCYRDRATTLHSGLSTRGSPCWFVRRVSSI